MQNIFAFWQRPGTAPFAVLVLTTLIILGHHFYRMQVSDLSRWKGGGMGMFSTQDAPGTRTISVMIETPEGRYLASHDALGRAGNHFTAMPTTDNLMALCNQVANKHWFALGNVRTVALNDGTLRSLPLAGTAAASLSDPVPLSISAITLNSWKTHINVSQRHIQRDTLGDALWSATGGCHVSH